MKFLILNGPNINLLGLREPALYGQRTYQDLLTYIAAEAQTLGVQIDCYQSNHEGDLIDRIQQACGTVDGIVCNPAAYTHTSVALLDAVKAVSIPTVEVHLTDPDAREPFRRVSYIREACIATVKGRGFEGYRDAMRILKEYLEK